MARKQATDSNKEDKTEVETSWFAQTGAYEDVIISTRVRLARNLADFQFPARMSEDEKDRVKSLVYDAFSADQAYRFIDTKELSEPGIEILKDKNILKNSDCSAVVFNCQDESTSCLVNESDHLKISSFVSGLDCEKAMAKVYKLDELLQQKLQFAASFDFGYLTSHIKDCGSGMKISLRVFIPSIIMAGQLEYVQSVVQDKKLSMKPVYKTTKISDFSYSLYDISTTNSSEGTEFDQMATIQAIGMFILKTERKFREELADNNPTVVLNFFKRNYAMAMYSLLLNYDEAVSIISAVKWGLQAKIISGVSETELNALYFRTKKGHLKYLCDNFSFTFEKDILSNEALQIERLRTIVIQQAFEGIVNEKPVS